MININNLIEYIITTPENINKRVFKEMLDTYTKQELNIISSQYTGPVWSWNNDYSQATATFTYGCGHTAILVDNSPVEEIITPADEGIDKVAKYTATIEFEGTEYTNTTENITIPTVTDNNG